MPTSPKTSRRLTAPFLLATASLSLFALHCGDDGTPATGTAGTSTLPMSGAGGTASQGGSSAGMAGSAVTAGTATGGTVGTAGTPATAGSGGVGGSAGGSGGSAGSGGGSGGSGGGGGSGATFGPVKALLAVSCKGSKCHDAASDEMDWVTSDGLYMRLTSPIPNDIDHCPGDTPVTKGMAEQSLIIRALKGNTMCSKAGGGMAQLARMPDHCGEGGNNPPCLTDAQIKTISDWIAAGAPE